MKFDHLMIDLETLGTAPNAPVLAIGAVFFAPATGALGEKFYADIDVEDAMRFGTMSGSTFKWWMQQSDAARAAAIKGTMFAQEAFATFRKFIYDGCSSQRHLRPWGNGASFDISIMDYAFNRITGNPAPWNFWNVRDVRTIKELGELKSPFTGKLQGTAHNALDDAVFQAGYVSHYWQALMGKENANPCQDEATADAGLLV